MIKKTLIIGLMAFIALSVSVPETQADSMCTVGTINTQYERIYCDIRLNDNDDLDGDLIKLMSKQFGLDKDIVEGILGGTICETVKKYKEEEIKKLPKSVQYACNPKGKTTAEVFGSGWNVFTDIQNSYQKEKMMRQSAKALEFRFEVSEQYWDGTINTTPLVGGDAPFDLIVDLNLIEIVLFGSKAQWMNDVYSFPKDEDEDGGGEDSPLDEAKPDDEGGEGSGDGAAPESGEIGITEGEEGENNEKECVSPDHPDADLGDGPSSDSPNPLCGNGTVDVLMAETCDDGNTDSGDGCNQYCQEEATGSNDICIDPDAVTFQSPEEAYGDEDGSNGGGQGGQSNQSECPPGTVPKKPDSIEAGDGTAGTGVPQAPEYPGGFLGGTLKRFPDSERPVCNPGESPLAITIGGETHFDEDGDGNIRCIPTEFCMDPDITRSFLAASAFAIPEGDWLGLPDNDERRKSIEAIEALFCINIIKSNRPQSAYQMIEGCVDCHISAMVDSLEKALQTNVTPLANTSSAFEISNKFGSDVSFNLNTALKGKAKYKSSDTIEKAVQKADRQTKEIQAANVDRIPNNIPNESPLAELGRITVTAQNHLDTIKEDTSISRMSNQVISEQEVNGRVMPLINQMRDSFTRIQSKYEEMISASNFDEKPQCR